MKITTRLSFQFTLVVAVILVFFSVMVYYFYYTSQLSKFRDNILNRAKNTAILLINVAEVDSTLLKTIHRTTISWVDEEIAITDSAHNMIYSNNINHLSDIEIKRNSGDEPFNYFSLAGKDGVCYKHNYNNHVFDVFVLAYDKARKENLSLILNILFWSTLFSIWLSVLLSYFYSKRAIRPISAIIKKVKEISSLKLNNRLDEGKREDEIEQLAVSFNEMISNLEVAFKNQEKFIANASHELRTPVTVMISESDYLLSNDNPKEVYINHVRVMVNDLKKINVLLSSLLELAHVNRYINIPFAKVRIDEVVFNAMQQVKSKYPNRIIIPEIQYPEDSNDFLINGNFGLLEMALKNIMDNACKFSDNEVRIELVFTDNHIRITVSDKGIGIPEDELKDICNVFKRASNAKFIGGYGIGLSLVSEILHLHEAVLKITSTKNDGTHVQIRFKRIVSEVK